LLVIGVLVVAGVYFHSRRQRGRNARSGARAGNDRLHEPRLSANDRDAFGEDFPEDLPPLRATDSDEPVTEDDYPSAGPSAGKATNGMDVDGEAVKLPVRDEKIIVLNILPQLEHVRFAGSDLLDIFDRAGLEYGLYNVFHRLKDTAEGPVSVFSVASATEPGSFDITDMADQEYRGLSLFMVLPGPMRGVDAFADMLATARRIAEQIRGEVKDRNRSTLTRQTAHHLREEIIAFEHRLQRKS
jgi:cell division protein ZipA